MQKTVKHGSNLVMVWGCMIARGLGLICQIEGRMIQYVYCAILESKLNNTLLKFGFNPRTIIFQHDSDPQTYNEGNKRMVVEATFQCYEVASTISRCHRIPSNIFDSC